MRKYQFSNSLMFAIVMHDPTACRGFIEKLFPERKVKAIYFPGEDGEMQETESKSLQDAVHAAAAGVGVEKTIITGLGSKSVRLDVLFEEDDTLYDIELQMKREEEIAKRSRYYHMAMARQTLKKGQSYSMLKASYVIFVCCFDAFGLDVPIYHFEMFDSNLQLKLEDGSRTIILNTKCSREKIPEELTAFYEFVDTGKVDEHDAFVRYLDTRVKEANHDEEVDRIMTLEEELRIRYDRGLRKGREEGIDLGAAQKQREIAKAMKESGAETEYILKVTGLALEEIEAL